MRRRRRAAAAIVLTTAVAGCGQNLQSLLPSNVLTTGSLAPAVAAPDASPQAGVAQPPPATPPAPPAKPPAKAATSAAPPPQPTPAAAAPAVGPTDGEGLVSSALASVTGVFAPSATVHAEPPVETYSRVARGILGCWFGPVGGMRRSHIFHADVAPEHKGGGSEIVLHVREEGNAPSPRALRAYRVSITGTGGGSSVVAENLRFPEAMGAAMQADVARWARGGSGCSGAVVGKAPEKAPAKPEKKKAKKRAPAVAKQASVKAPGKQ